VFWKRLRREIFAPKWEERPGCWKKLHNDELTDLYLSVLTKCYSGGPIRAVELGGACGKQEEKEK